MHKPKEQPIFAEFTNVQKLSEALNTSPKQLNYLLYVISESSKYTSFTIKKRRGGDRQIKSPRSELKGIQRRLADYLQDRVTVRSCAHGFVRDKSIRSNAEQHVKHRLVLNLDLKNFFPSINFGRVRGLFMSPAFGAPEQIATILAQICCHENSLPQGAPTSPIISNLICSKLDAQLQKLARTHHCFYSRYADDITISKKKGVFPSEIASGGIPDDLILGEQLRKTIEGNGFEIHPDKIHLYRNTYRQSVTGLTVNSRVNVQREYVRQIRAIICDWRRRGLNAAQTRHHTSYYRRPCTLGEPPPLPRILEGKLNFLKMIRGNDDPLRRNLQRQLVEVWPDYERIMNKENSELNMRQLFISHASEDKDAFVRPFAAALIREGITVWYDEYEMTIGSDIAAKINEGLAHSQFGVVVMSPSFFGLKKTWPDREVGALTAQEDVTGKQKILPIWHNIDKAAVVKVNPLLARLLAWKSSDYSPEELAKKFREYLAKNS